MTTDLNGILDINIIDTVRNNYLITIHNNINTIGTCHNILFFVSNILEEATFQRLWIRPHIRQGVSVYVWKINLKTMCYQSDTTYNLPHF